MKSPTSSVGRIDDDGILKGSARNERNRKTTRRTGKNDLEYSTQTGSGAPGARRAAKNSRSTSQMTPARAVRTNRIRAKFIGKRTRGREPQVPAHGISPARHCRTASLAAHLEDRQERFLGDLDAADRLHPLLAGLLLLEQLLLPGDVAAVALGQHVLAQRLDVLARDDLRADRRLDGNVEHLPRDQRAHLGRHLT